MTALRIQTGGGGGHQTFLLPSWREAGRQAGRQTTDKMRSTKTCIRYIKIKKGREKKRIEESSPFALGRPSTLLTTKITATNVTTTATFILCLERQHAELPDVITARAAFTSRVSRESECVQHVKRKKAFMDSQKEEVRDRV